MIINVSYLAAYVAAFLAVAAAPQTQPQTKPQTQPEKPVQKSAPKLADGESELVDKSFVTPDAERVAGEEEKANRLTVPVRIEGQGPYKFIIDTASQRTILSNELAGGLALDIEDEVNIVALAGNYTVQTVFVPELTLGSKSYGGLVSPVLRSKNIGADGVLGLDGLQGQRILFDFQKNQIAIEDAGKKLKPSSSGDIIVTARRRSGQLIFTRATISGVKVNVIIDTGGQLSIGNNALRKSLRLRSESLHQIRLTDVQGRDIPAGVAIARNLRIDRAQFGQIPIAFADIPPFRALKLHRRPALFLGMDALRKFDRVAIDFENRKIYLKIPDDAEVFRQSVSG